MQHLSTSRTSGRLIYRRGIPTALRPHVPKAMREFVRSLGCKDLSSPGAMVRYAGFNAEFDKMLVVARKAVTRQFDALDTSAIGYLSDRYHTNLL